jgi:peptidoglycan/LPS O-acetylase OafA/YrhL
MTATPLTATPLADLPLRTERAPAIDLLRAAFALWVLFSHLMPWARQAAGESAPLEPVISALARLFQPQAETHPAVLGFIVLSGYCIHRNGLRRHAADLGGYAIRRGFRIVPVYVLATLAGVAVFLAGQALAPGLVAALSGTRAITADCLAVKLTGVSAFLPGLHECSFQGNAPLTTVMVEMWLYAAYPLLLALALHRGERATWGAILVIWAAGLAWAAWHPADVSWWHNGSFAGYLLYWWIGAKFNDPRALALARRWAWALAAGWLLLSVAELVGGSALMLVELRKIVLAIGFGAAINLLDREWTSLPRALAAAGKAGYSLYAFHAPLLILCFALGAPWWVAGAAAIGCGFAAYALVEAPCLRLGRRLARHSPGKAWAP